MSTRTVLVTGVSRGLGAALVEAFVAQGLRVVGCARSESAIAELRERHDAGKHRFDGIDVTDADGVDRWASELSAQGIVPDLLLNNAATINRNAPLWEVPHDEFQNVVDVNITGSFNVARAFLPGMIRRGSGVVVNFSSGWGRSTSPEVAPYCASKWAIEGLTAALAQELPAGLAAVALNPGIIDTALLQSCFGNSASSFDPPEIWAKTAAPFLLGLGAQHNGQALTAP